MSERNWSDLKTDERAPYVDAARKILYPDPRAGYRDHEKLMGLLARNLFYLEQEGGLQGGALDGGR